MAAAAFDPFRDDAARYEQVSARGAAAGPIANSNVFAWVMQPIARGQSREIAWLMQLGDGGRFVRLTELRRGEPDSVIVCASRSCADVAAAALEGPGRWCILSHDHPTPRWLGGGAWPSVADAELTTAVGRALGRHHRVLLDHVILGDDQHYSFTERQLWQTTR